MAMVDPRNLRESAAGVALAKNQNPGAEIFTVPGDTGYLYGFEQGPGGEVMDFVIERSSGRRMDVSPGSKGYDAVVAQRESMFPQAGRAAQTESRLDEALESAGSMSSPAKEDASGRPVLEAPTFTQVEDRMYVGDKPRAFEKTPGMPQVKMPASDKTSMEGAKAALGAAESPREARQVVDQMLGILENRKGPMDEGLRDLGKQLRGMRKARVGELKQKS